MGEPFIPWILQESFISGAVGVAKICNRLGFDSADSHALDTLIDVVGKYIETIGFLTKTLTEHDGRRKSQLEDLLQAFRTMEPHKVDWKNLVQMADEMMWDVAFANGVPEFPVNSKDVEEIYAKKDPDTQRLPSYIPGFYPPFPEEHTYKRTYVDATKPLTEPAQVIDKVVEQRQLARESLSKIHQKELSMTGTNTSFGEERLTLDSNEADMTITKVDPDAPPLPSAFKNGN